MVESKGGKRGGEWWRGEGVVVVSDGGRGSNEGRGNLIVVCGGWLCLRAVVVCGWGIIHVHMREVLAVMLVAHCGLSMLVGVRVVWAFTWVVDVHVGGWAFALVVAFTWRVVAFVWRVGVRVGGGHWHGVGVRVCGGRWCSWWALV